MGCFPLLLSLQEESYVAHQEFDERHDALYREAQEVGRVVKRSPSPIQLGEYAGEVIDLTLEDDD